MLGSIKNENPAYTYSLYSKGKNGGDDVEIIGRLPQEWLVGVGSEWSGNAAGNTLADVAQSGGIVGTAANATVTLGGNNLGSTALSNRQWSGGQALTFNLLAEFNAYDDALKDVMKPLILLQSMSMATGLGNIAAGNASLGNLIGAPYWEDATTSGQIGGKSTIILRIGKMFVFDDMIVENVSAPITMKLAEPGIPIKVSVEMQVSTRGPITFEQYVSYMTGDALTDLFSEDNIIKQARDKGPGQKAGYTKLDTTAPTR